MDRSIVKFGEHIFFAAVEVVDGDDKVLAVDLSFFNYIRFFVHDSELLRNQNDEYYKIHSLYPFHSFIKIHFIIPKPMSDQTINSKILS